MATTKQAEAEPHNNENDEAVDHDDTAVISADVGHYHSRPISATKMEQRRKHTRHILIIIFLGSSLFAGVGFAV